MICKEIKFYLAEDVKNDAGNLNKGMITCLELFHQTKIYKGGTSKKKDR